LRILDASKRGQICRKGAYSAADLLAVARRLYNAPDMQLYIPGQQDGLLAVIEPHPAEQVVLVIGTGSGKSLIFIIGASVADARTTILVLPIVILRGNILKHCYLISIRPLIWLVDIKQSASLVIILAEAVYTETFLDYARGLVSWQKLDRIVIDKGHLIITTSDYRPCIAQLG
jgi:hypothetical protein